jgi:hypothetical protein
MSPAEIIERATEVGGPAICTCQRQPFGERPGRWNWFRRFLSVSSSPSAKSVSGTRTMPKPMFAPVAVHDRRGLADL